MNPRGQISFEVLLAIAAVFLLTFMVAGHYITEHDTTYAMAKVKTAVLSAVHNRGEAHMVFVSPNMAVQPIGGLRKVLLLNVTLDPEPALLNTAAVSLLPARVPGAGTLCQEIADETAFDDVTLQVHGHFACSYSK